VVTTNADLFAARRRRNVAGFTTVGRTGAARFRLRDIQDVLALGKRYPWDCLEGWMHIMEGMLDLGCVVTTMDDYVWWCMF
jgi:hypothetical protein